VLLIVEGSVLLPFQLSHVTCSHHELTATSAKWPEVLSKLTLRTPKANCKSFLNLLVTVIIRSTDLAEPQAASLHPPAAAFHSQTPRNISSNVRTFNLALRYSEFVRIQLALRCRSHSLITSMSSTISCLHFCPRNHHPPLDSSRYPSQRNHVQKPTRLCALPLLTS
jgi:hypothetical protein